jgi:type III secretion protein L
MALWLRSGDHDIGALSGVVRRDDYARLVEACELNTQAARLLTQAGEEAVAIVAEAVGRATQTLAAAELEGAAIRSTARREGLREGVERWAEEMASKAFEAKQSIDKASERLAELVSLATQRVIEVEDKEGLYRRALRTVRHLAKDSKTLVLHIGSTDETYARSVVAGIAGEMGIEVPIEIKVDARLKTGGCVLESDYGVIDASLGLQLDAVKSAISKAARAALARNDPADEDAQGDARPSTPEAMADGL